MLTVTLNDDSGNQIGKVTVEMPTDDTYAIRVPLVEDFTMESEYIIVMLDIDNGK